MVREIGAFEAKTHLSRLLDSVRRGERFIITRHGHPVAELRPCEEEEERVEASEVFRGLARLRMRLRAQGVRRSSVLAEGERLRDLAHAGHRW